MFFEGQEIGTYVLLRRLGRGGFGEVWLAEKRSQFVSKKVAVKLPLDDQVDLGSIRQEAQLWEQASGHPNVLPIIDADIIDGQVLIVSEYADGGSLADLIKRDGKLPLQRSVELTIGILNGLEFLHSRQIIHRDIKPANVLLQGETPRLADFGISRAMNATAVSLAVIGTDAYMAPEAFDGKRSVQTDIWSVGVVLYTLLADSLPFPQEHPSERLFAILTKDFEPLPESCGPELKAVVARALAKQPEQRYASAAQMRDDLQRILLRLAHPTHAPTEVFRYEPPAPTPPIPKPDLPTIETRAVPQFLTETPLTEVRTVVGNVPAPQSTPAPTQASPMPPFSGSEPRMAPKPFKRDTGIGRNLLIIAAGLTVVVGITLIAIGIRTGGSFVARNVESESTVDLSRDGELNSVISGTTPRRTFSDPAKMAVGGNWVLAEIDSTGSVKLDGVSIGGIGQPQEFVSRLKARDPSRKQIFLVAPQQIRRSLIKGFFKALSDAGATDLTLFLESDRLSRTPGQTSNVASTPVPTTGDDSTGKNIFDLTAATSVYAQMKIDGEDKSA